MSPSPYLTFGPVGDTAGIASLCAALLALALGFHRGSLRFFESMSRTRLLAVLSLAAALLSFGYLAYFLRGGPRIIDATAYYLQARTLAEGSFSFPIPEPSAAFRGRFLLPTHEGERLAVIFPPGYPLALAAGFALGFPLAVGPLIAALLVPATYFTSITLLGDARAARVAAALSVACAALRYHTADTMSHGLSALLLCLALGAAARGGALGLAGAGLASGWLCATRPVTGAACLLLSVGLAITRHRGAPVQAPAAALTVLGGSMPGIFFLLAQQRAVTGSFFGSTQLAYYAVADGPPGCFRWGLGSEVGCLFEHADVVKNDLPNGFGVVEAVRVTLGRLMLHAIDIANLAPLALLVPITVVLFFREKGVRWLGAAVLLIVLGYAPFYFPGSYPGGGARFFADALPLEHALVGLAVVRARAARLALAGALFGFALHAIHSHRALAEREGGRPMFEPERLRNVTRGLVFVTTDHGFLLGHDPAVRSAREGLVVARAHGDAHDLVAWERLGRPASYLYEYSPSTGQVSLGAYHPKASTPARFELEAEWPPLAVQGGFAHPDFRPCLSAGRGLRLRPRTAPLTVSVPVTPLHPGEYQLSLGWLADPGSALAVSVAGAEFTPVDGGQGECARAALGQAKLGSSETLLIRTRSEVLLDYLELTPIESKKR